MDFDLGTTSDSVTACEEAGDSSAGGTPAQHETEKRRGQGPDRRKEKRVNRRSGLERRQIPLELSDHEGPERRSGNDRRNTLERRRGPGRRLADDRRAAEEGEMTAHQFEFIEAIQAYKKINKRMYPTFTEILEVLNQLGYRKVLKRDFNLEVPEPELFDGDGEE